MPGIHYTRIPFSGVDYTKASSPAKSRLSDLNLDILAISFTLGIGRVSFSGPLQAYICLIEILNSRLYS